MKKTFDKNDNFLDIEASAFVAENGEKLVRVSFRNLVTEKGPQVGMYTHTRILSGDNKGYIATSETVWPRAFATDADLDLLKKSDVKDFMLRFGWGKKILVTDEKTGEQHEEETWGTPKWVAWFDGSAWHELQGAKIPFESTTDAADASDADTESGEES